MAPIPYGKSRAVAKLAYTGTVTQQLALVRRVADNFLLHAALFTDGATNAPAILVQVGLATQILVDPKTAANRAQRDQVSKDLKEGIRILVDYVNSVCRGQRRLLVLSGLPLNKEVKNKKPLSAVTNLRQFISPQVTTGDIKINWNKPQGTKTRKGISYTIEILPQPVSVNPRVIGITNKTFFTFTSNIYGPSPHRIRVTPVGGAPSPYLTVYSQF